jgi:hypothetical protein
MNSKMLIYIFLSVGSFVGGWIPTLWGASALGIASVIGAFVGGALGIWAGFKLSQMIGG